MLKQCLNLGVSQQLQLTPKLQQAIHMLLLSTQELNEELQVIVDSNIVLEGVNEIEIPETELETTESFPNTEINIDWDDSAENIYTSQSQPEKDIPIAIGSYYQTTLSLQEHLRWQLDILNLTEQEHIIGEVIIDSINENGYLEISLAEIKNSLKNIGLIKNTKQIEQVLRLVQTLDPLGVAARDLAECLLIQLNAKVHSLEVGLAKQIVKNHIQLLASHNYLKICQIYKIAQAQLDKVIALIQRLNPRPGNAIDNSEIDTVTPDVIVKKENGQWQVALNKYAIPKVRINNCYKNVDDGYDANAQTFINNHLQEARWLMKCLHNRNETLLKVTASIVKHQQGFFEHGEMAMKPLVLRDIAEDLGMHQSTISRITTRKYVQTPRGTYELKYFFTSHLNTSFGQQCSGIAIQNYIRNIIESEDRTHPLSDEAVSKKLLARGIQLARRTVTKYRELLAIPSAAARKIVMQC